MSIPIELKNLKRNLDMITSWGYRNSEKVDGGIVFYVDTPSEHIGKVFVDLRAEFECVCEIDFGIVEPKTENLVSGLHVSLVPAGQLFEVIDKMIKGKLSESDCEALSKQYKKEYDKAWASWGLTLAHDIIMGYTPWNQAGSRKGFIFTDDGKHLDSNFAKEQLKYDVLKKNGKVNEITIDGSWPLKDKIGSEEYAKVYAALWKKLVTEADKVKDGLLVINVLDINLFLYCDCLKQLVKEQEYHEIDFSGYVLLVIKDIDWNEVEKFVEKVDRAWTLKDMMDQWYRLY